MRGEMLYDESVTSRRQLNMGIEPAPCVCLVTEYRKGCGLNHAEEKKQ